MAKFVVRHLDADAKEKRQNRARNTEEEVREILRNAGDSTHTPLGSRIAARFRRVGLDSEIPELRSAPVRPPTAVLKSRHSRVRSTPP